MAFVLNSGAASTGRRRPSRTFIDDHGRSHRPQQHATFGNWIHAREWRCGDWHDCQQFAPKASRCGVHVQPTKGGPSWHSTRASSPPRRINSGFRPTSSPTCCWSNLKQSASSSVRPARITASGLYVFLTAACSGLLTLSKSFSPSNKG